MNTELLHFISITGLTEAHAGIVESQLAGVMRYFDQGASDKANTLLVESLAMWGKMGTGGRIIAAEAASLFAAAGMVEMAECIIHEAKVSPINMNALLPLAQTVLGVKFYREKDGCNIVDMLSWMGAAERFGPPGRAGVLDRLVASKIDWPLGIDARHKSEANAASASCSRALDLYWNGHGAGWGKKKVDRASMQEAMNFVKALARHGSDPVGGFISTASAAIPARHIMSAEPDMWLFEQVVKMGWLDDRAREQAWSTAVREDVGRIYRKAQKLGDRAQALDRLGVEIPKLSIDCNRRWSLKMVALDSACLPMIKRIKTKGLDVDWRGPEGKDGFFSANGAHAEDALERTLEAAKGMALPFTPEHLLRQCSGVNAVAIKFMLKQDPSIVDRVEAGHPLGAITTYTENENNQKNIGRMIEAFSENARERGAAIAVNAKMLKSFIRSGVIKTMMENLDCFSFGAKTSTPLFTKICAHGVKWSEQHSQTLVRLTKHLLDTGVKLPAGQKRQGALVASAMQSRNHSLAMALLDMGVKIEGMLIEDFIPKVAKKADGDNQPAMAQALLALARSGVVMANIDGPNAAWVNPMIAAAQHTWMEGAVDEVASAPAVKAAKPRF